MSVFLVGRLVLPRPLERIQGNMTLLQISHVRLLHGAAYRQSSCLHHVACASRSTTWVKYSAKISGSVHTTSIVALITLVLLDLIMAAKSLAYLWSRLLVFSDNTRFMVIKCSILVFLDRLVIVHTTFHFL